MGGEITGRSPGEWTVIMALLRTLRGALSLLLMSLNVIFWTFPIVFIHFIKLAIPSPIWRRFWSGLQNDMGTLWISLNNLNLRIFSPVRWEVELPEGLDRKEWYMVVANHQSWVDILVLQRIFNGKIPFLKFFLKKELFWVPFMGLAWWALDFPFLERSRNAAKDLETIGRAADKFKIAPVSIMNFVEGTRFSSEKHEKQRSPYTHLLKPKAGGLTFLLTAMGERLPWILDVSIAYPGVQPTLWKFLCGEMDTIRVQVRKIPVGQELLGDFAGDKAFRRTFLSWLNEEWEEKDGVMAQLMNKSLP
jgi:1-acyl-sn-glycerol-3-phosphate acyltransferase